MIVNAGSPIIQNTFNGMGGIPFNNNNGFAAASMADLTGGQYCYNPATRFQQNFMNPPMMGQQMMGYQQPVGYNYYNSGVQFGYQQPQMMGYGMMPQQNSAFGTLGYNPGGYPQYPNGYNRQNGLSFGGGINQPTYQDQTYNQPGYSPYGQMMFASTDLDRFNDIMARQTQEQESYQDKMNAMYQGMNYNYYGNFNYYNPYISSKYQKEQYQIIEEAKQRQVDFNKKLSRIAHTYLGDELDDEYYDSIYDEQQVTIPASNIKNYQEVQRLNMFTMDYGEWTKQQFYAANNAISEEYHNRIVNDTDDLCTFLGKAGELYALGMQYDIEKAKKDKSRLYDRNGFNNYLQKQLAQRNLFPTLTANGEMLADGTLQIKAPAWITKATKETEESYQRDRQRFIDSIYNRRE